MLTDPEVAPRQCWISPRRGGLLIEDAKSPGGTWVNGVRIVAAYLAPGAVIRIGSTHLVPVTSRGPLFPTVESFVKDAIELHGTVRKAAMAIGIPRPTLARWIAGGLARKRGERAPKARRRRSA